MAVFVLCVCVIDCSQCNGCGGHSDSAQVTAAQQVGVTVCLCVCVCVWLWPWLWLCCFVRSQCAMAMEAIQTARKSQHSRWVCREKRVVLLLLFRFPLLSAWVLEPEPQMQASTQAPSFVALQTLHPMQARQHHPTAHPCEEQTGPRQLRWMASMGPGKARKGEGALHLLSD